MNGLRTLPIQIAHLKEHQKEFTDHTGSESVEEYLAEYEWERPDIYVRVCDDLGLTPVGMDNYTVTITNGAGQVVFSQIIDSAGATVLTYGAI